MADQKTVTGFISKAGERISGVGDYTVVKSGTGLYNVVFRPPFAAPPVVVSTQVFPNNIADGGGSTRDNAVIVGITDQQVRIKVGDGNGSAQDRDFTFIAMGIPLTGTALADWEAEHGHEAAAHEG